MQIDFSKLVSAETLNEEYKAKTKQAISERRYLEETKGISGDKISFRTDRQSQSLITSAALSAILDKDYVCRWKTDDGFVTLTADQIMSISSAVRSHVQGCFDNEYRLVELVDKGEYATDMLDSGWPE